MNKAITKAIYILGIILFTQSAFAISHAVMSKLDFTMILQNIRKINIMVENFSDKKIQADFNEIKSLFNEASEQHFGRNFFVSSKKFINIKYKLITFLKQLSKVYLLRTKKILDSTSQRSMEIIVKYSKNSGLAAYFKKPFDPIHDKRAYNPHKYHYFHKRHIIQDYIKEGYREFNSALLRLNDKNIRYILRRKFHTRKGLNYILDQYLRIINSCRISKQYGIEILKIINNFQMAKNVKAMEQYNLTARQITPIYDERIPDNFKVDANDNLNYIHKHELALYKKRTGSDHSSKNVKIDVDISDFEKKIKARAKKTKMIEEVK